ncbi:subtilisin-like protein [Pleomassaria siparia CBS 279.74]|uniref:tripeptidyl-peptidase II n=1 Tax=Pleomassaria siparia CBS 279.74 TaxID=1314801 RepID=A0A6G1K7P0_9PLEO|nr:subtilisin-like protein [Pleomassaria siparia CBS 279.74]
MLGVSFLLTVAAAAQVILATPVARSTYSVKETHHVPRGWTQKGRAPKSQMLAFQIGVKQGDFAELERQLYEVSDPSHPRYGQHLSHEQVNEIVKPKDEALDLVHEWLLSNGVNAFDYSPSKDWINIKISIEDAERLLDTEYSTYVHVDGTEAPRTTKWSLPLHLHEHIDTIQPTTSFMRIKKNAVDYVLSDNKVYIPADYKPPTDQTLARVCTINGTTPECFKTLYKTLGYKPKALSKNKIAFNNFLGEVPIRPDAKLFLEKYEPSAVSGAQEFKFISIDGGPQQDGNLTADQLAEGTSREANLDVQTILGMTYPMSVIAYTTGGEPPQIPDAATGDPPGNEPYLAWVTYVLKQEDLPQVVSTSYGDDEQTVPIAFAKRVCSDFAQLGARGVSLLFSSGDGGAGDIAGNHAELCISNDGKNTTKFLASFPASCPYVTTVGATQGFQPEVAAYRPANSLGPDGKLHGYYASGSGFSEYFSRPKYQDSAVQGYLEKIGSLHKGLYNTAGRGYPDISAQGLYFEYFWNATNGIISGTSASAPLMSSVIALVNDDLISWGKSPLGFLNPWLYQKGYKGFTDILGGGNGGCNTTGFPVTKDWDAVTGFGTPIFPEIVKLAK